MRDIHNLEVKAGDICHIVWKGEDSSGDLLATAIRTRGRGIKFVTDDEKTYTTGQLDDLKASVIITNRSEDTTLEDRPKNTGFSSEEIQLLEKLRRFGWVGTLTRETGTIKYQVTLG